MENISGGWLACKDDQNCLKSPDVRVCRENDTFCVRYFESDFNTTLPGVTQKNYINQNTKNWYGPEKDFIKTSINGQVTQYVANDNNNDFGNKKIKINFNNTDLQVFGGTILGILLLFGIYILYILHKKKKLNYSHLNKRKY